MNLQAIIFDCFGVLYPDTFWTMAHEFLSDEDFKIHESGLHDLVRQVDMGYITREQLWQQFAVIVGETEASIFDRLEQFGGLDQRLLDFIDAHKSEYKIGMISNVGEGFLERMFTGRSAESYFDVIILSSQVGMVKPDKRIYELAAQKLNCPVETCVFIDDLEKNVEGARLAGMQAVQYRHFSDFKTKIAQFIPA